MGWEDTRKLRRSETIVGWKVRDLRKQLGWTQEELAANAGYTARLVRKAEGGGSLHPDTIEVLAEALSTEQMRVNPEDLIVCPTNVVSEYVRAYRGRERQMVADFQVHLDPAVECFIAGDPEQIPFAGTWRSPDGYDRFWGLYFQLFARPDKTIYRPRIICEGNTGVALGQEAVAIKELGIQTSSWVVINFEFCRGRVTRIEHYFDTQDTADRLRDLPTPPQRGETEPGKGDGGHETE